MEKEFCIGCDGQKYPSCIIFNIINAVALEDIINNNAKKKSQYLVCHKNAQKFEGGKIIIQSSCDDCMLCQIACNKVPDVEIDFQKIEKSVLNDLGRLNIFASSINEETLTATEVKASGNFRQKRIDLVLKKDNTIALIKVSRSLDKYNFYSRSYKEIIDFYKSQYTEIDFCFKTLIPQNKKAQGIQLGVDFILLDEISNILGDDKSHVNAAE